MTSGSGRELSQSDIMAGDDLNAYLGRECILLGADQGSGKSMSVALLILDGLEQGFNVVVLDRDRGLAKAMKEVFIDGRIESARDRLEELGMFGKMPENVDYFLANTWDRIPKVVKHAFATLEAGDWFVAEQVGRLWDLAQTEYSRQVYGEELSEHLLVLRSDAQKIIREMGADLRSNDPAKRKAAQTEVAKAMAYSGMEGRTDWSVIKRMHNDDVRDRLILESDFNVLLTTTMKRLSDDEVQKGAHPMFHGIMARPEGESHNVAITDTVAVCYKKANSFLWRTDLGNMRGKDRSNPLYKDVDCTDVGFVESYKQTLSNGLE